MTFDERFNWVFGIVTTCSYGIYLAVVLCRADGGPLHEVAYAAPLLWSIGGTVGVSIFGQILLAIIWSKDCGKRDLRDREIHRYGEYVGQSFVVMGGAAAMFMSMAKIDHFWIANAVCFVVSALIAATTKIITYRRGFPLCSSQLE